MIMKKITPQELNKNAFDLIGKQWAMITTKSADGKVNTMPASWGGVGILWHKPVTYIFLRPQRYTRELMDASETFSACFLPEEYRDQLKFCGAHSGRDTDKLTECGFDSITLDDTPALAQSEIVVTCRKLYRQKFDPACFIVPGLDEKNYPNKDYHYVYVGEILGVYEK